MARKTVKDKACDKKNDEVLFPKVEKVLGGASYDLMKLMQHSNFAEALKRFLFKTLHLALKGLSKTIQESSF